MKKCNKCGFEKEAACFYVYRTKCKDCVHLEQREYDRSNTTKEKKKIYRQEHLEENKTYQKEYRQKNKEEIAVKDAKRRQENKEVRKQQQRDYYAKPEIKQARKIYREEHAEEIAAYKKEYLAKEETKQKRSAARQKRRKEDPLYKLRIDISSAINHALNGTKNNISCMDYLPYTIKQLKQHLEQQFSIPNNEWMNWNNHGKHNSKTYDPLDNSTWTWNIDHIIPQSLLPYSSMEEENFQKCWALSNLRPLKAIDNIKKGNKIQ